jgi:colicin import membrane protein
VEGLRQDLQDGDKAIATAEKAVAFIDGPVKAHGDAAAAIAKAKEEKDPAAKVKQLTEVQDAYKRCAEDGEKALADAPGLDKATVVTSPKPLTGALIVKECKAQAEVAGKLLVPAKKIADAAARKAELEEKKKAAAEAKKAAAEAKKEELAKKKAELEEKKKAAAEAKKAAAEAKKEELAKKKAELEEKKKAAAEAKKAAAEAKKAELEEKKKAAAEAKKNQAQR